MKEDELKHFGIRGMKWGIRRYQNEDGSYTEEGRLRYKKALSEMSDDDLRKLVDRTRRQKEYYELIAQRNKAFDDLNPKVKRALAKEAKRAAKRSGGGFAKSFGETLGRGSAEKLLNLFNDDNNKGNNTDYNKLLNDLINAIKSSAGSGKDSDSKTPESTKDSTSRTDKSGKKNKK